MTNLYPLAENAKMVRLSGMMRCLFFMVLLMLAGCSSVPVAQYKSALPMPENAHPAPMMLSNVKYKLPMGESVGSVGSGWCIIRMELGRGDLADADSLKNLELKDIFRDTMDAEGYDVSGRADLMFDEEADDDMLRSEYRVGAEITDVQTDLCARSSVKSFWYAPTPGLKGELYLKIRWHIYDALHRTTVFKTESEGYAKRAAPNPEGIGLLTREAFAMAAHNLGADASFQALIVNGIRPPKDAGDSLPARPRHYDPTEKLIIDNKPLSTKPFPQHADASRKVAVMVQAGVGHGSGFMISPRGDILTNAHVVGNALHVRVVMADRAEALTAEVVKSDKPRDVAWLHLIDPPRETLTVLPIRVNWPGVGERVYVIGAPEMTRLQDSLTSGIVSAWRKNFELMGTRQDLIQSDVTVQPGNSGGPMLDANGNIVGFTVAGVGDSNNGLNYFVPIGSALDILGIEIK